MTSHDPSPIVVDVLGTPKPQPRPRAFVRHGHARVYDAGTAEGWKGAIALALRPHLPAVPWSGPVAVWLAFRLQRPKAHSTRRGIRADAPQWHTSKPDTDNLAKAVLDCLTQLRVWQDDGQVARITIEKTYSESPGCGIRVQPLDGEND